MRKISGLILMIFAAVSNWPAVRASEVERLPFKLYRDYIVVVQGSIGDLEGLSFIVDTGSTPSVVSSSSAARLKLSQTAERLSVFTRDLRAAQVVLPQVQLGPIQIDSLPVLVQDLSFLQSALNRPIDAIVGLDLLGRSNFTVDYAAKEILFGRGDRSRAAVQIEKGDDFVIVPVKIHDESVRLLVVRG